MDKEQSLRREFISFKLIEMRFEGIKQYKEEMKSKCDAYLKMFPPKEVNRIDTLKKYGLEKYL